MNTEIRSYSTELRASSEAEFALSGYAAKFNVISKDIPGPGGSFNELILPGAFTKVLADPETDCRCLFNHDINRILGRQSAGTLALEQDGIGLRFKCQLSRDNTEHSNIYSSVRRGDLNECSFGFLCTGGDSWQNRDGKILRTIRQFSMLSDVSVVANPAYPQTVVAARNLPTSARSIEALRAKAARQGAEIALTLRQNPKIAIAIRNGISIEALLDAELRLKAAELAREIWEKE